MIAALYVRALGSSRGAAAFISSSSRGARSDWAPLASAASAALYTTTLGSTRGVTVRNSPSSWSASSQRPPCSHAAMPLDAV